MSDYVKKDDILKHLCEYCDSHIVGCGECPIKAAIYNVPVISLPKEHGDLIDRDALMIELMDRGIEGVQTDDLAEFQQIVMDAKAVIAAERKDDGNI